MSVYGCDSSQHEHTRLNDELFGNITLRMRSMPDMPHVEMTHMNSDIGSTRCGNCNQTPWLKPHP